METIVFKEKKDTYMAISLTKVFSICDAGLGYC